MPIAAISYGIRTGCDEQAAEIFGNLQRAGSPAVFNAHGTEVGRILRTAR
ncbi:MAG: SchA/CurD-like domain-containing protein [Pseudonocardiaceae bacterium]